MTQAPYNLHGLCFDNKYDCDGDVGGGTDKKITEGIVCCCRD